MWQKHGNSSSDEGQTHRTEMDILFEYYGMVYLISCKSSLKYTPLEKTVKEAEAMASVLGRFAISLVAVMDFNEDIQKKEIEGRKVYVIGPKVLASKKRFIKAIKETTRERQKTV